MEKTIQNSNFVQFMHEVVNLVEEGFTLDYETKNAPESTPQYRVTLVKKEAIVEDVTQVVEDTTQVVEKTTEEKSEEVESPSDVVVKKPQGRLKK